MIKAKLDAQTILHTARIKYKVDVSLIFGNLVLDAAPGVSIAPAVVTKHWDTLANYLSKQPHLGLREWLAQHQRLPLCAACLDVRRETQALPDDHQSLMYCNGHYPVGTLWDKAVVQYSGQLGSWQDVPPWVVKRVVQQAGQVRAGTLHNMRRGRNKKG